MINFGRMKCLCRKIMERKIILLLYIGNYFNVFKGFYLGDFVCKRRVLDGLVIEFSLI